MPQLPPEFDHEATKKWVHNMMAPIHADIRRENRARRWRIAKFLLKVVFVLAAIVWVLGKVWHYATT